MVTGSDIQLLRRVWYAAVNSACIGAIKKVP